MKKLLFIVAICATSCITKPLYKTGEYTIKTRSGNSTTFYNLRGTYQLVSDTLKPGDKVTMINVHTKHR